MKEEAVQFGELDSLVGIVTNAAPVSHEKPGVILLNPGIVHRVGPGRIYVRIARALAAQGFTVLRFDLSGIGDSSVRLDNRPFEESSVDEAIVAMRFLQATKGISQFVLLGGCSGATVSLETARADRRAIGAIMINFPARVDEGEEANGRKDGHYYFNFALLSMKSWRKLLTGRSDYWRIGRALLRQWKDSFAGHEKPSDSDQRFRTVLRELADRGVSLTFICSKGDPLLRGLREAGGADLKRLCGEGKVTCDVIPRSDHTFSALYDQERLVDAILARANEVASKLNQPAPASAIVSGCIDALFQRGN